MRLVGSVIDTVTLAADERGRRRCEADLLHRLIPEREMRATHVGGEVTRPAGAQPAPLIALAPLGHEGDEPLFPAARLAVDQLAATAGNAKVSEEGEMP